MNKFLKLSISGIMIGGILVGCNETSETTEIVKPKEEVKNTAVAAAEVETISWEDVNGNFGEWISEMVTMFSEPSNDPRLKETDFDEGFGYYLKAKKLQEEMNNIHVEGESIEKDLTNLFTLHAYIGHEQFVRTAHLDPNGQAKEQTEYFEQWKPTDEYMRQAYEYMNQLLHDLDVVVNHNGEGETYGVSHLMDGDKVSELESFYSGGGE